MNEGLEQLIRETIVARGISDPRVIDAIRQVPRQCFVPGEAVTSAYSDGPLPIGWGQTISQPYIVALMTEAAAVRATDCCLEIGTGSGYQTAVLLRLCREVYSIECVEALYKQSQRNLNNAGCQNLQLHLRLGNGYLGWPEIAPFDVIVVTAAPPTIPPPLLNQLAMGGRLIIPVGPDRGTQQLQRWTRIADGQHQDAFSVDRLLDVRFVPMVDASKTV